MPLTDNLNTLISELNSLSVSDLYKKQTQLQLAANIQALLSTSGATGALNDILTNLTTELNTLSLNDLNKQQAKLAIAATIKGALGGGGISAQLGFDVIPVLGQSNAVGFATGIDAALDYTDSRILQFASSGSYKGQIILAVDPLWHSQQGAANTLGFDMQFARNYIRYTNRPVLLVPCAFGGTGFTDLRWNSGNDLFELAVSQTIAALSTNPGNKLIAVCWHQGENDSLTTVAASNHLNALTNMINAFRLRVNAPNLPFIVGEMLTSWIGVDALKLQVNANLVKLPSVVPNTYCVSSLNLVGTGNPTDPHFNAASQRELGNRYFFGFYSQFLAPSLPLPIQNITAIATANSAVINWDGDPATNWQISVINLTAGTPFLSFTTRIRGYTLTGLANNTTYAIAITSSNRNGSNPPVAATFKTLAVTPLIPIIDIKLNGNVTDTSANNYPVANNGVTFTTVSGKGTVGVFGGASPTFAAANAVPITLTNYTKSAYVYLTANATGGYPAAICSMANNGAPINILTVSSSVGQKIGELFNPAYEGSAVTSPSVFPLNTWVHAIAVYSGTSAFLYLNGLLVATATIANPTGGIPVNLLIGCFSNSAGNNWIGYMKNIKYFNFAITSDQALQLSTSDSV